MLKEELYNALKDCVRVLLLHDATHPVTKHAFSLCKKYDNESNNKQWLAQSFDKFWKLYPKKTLKKQAKEKWYKLNPDEFLFSIILEQLNYQIKYKEYCNKNNTFCAEFQDAVRWIRNERWTDEVPQIKPKTVILNRNGT
jgi:hypothetical protein